MSAGVHNPKPNGPLLDEQFRQVAVPLPRDYGHRTATCVCGRPIRTSCFGWVHEKNLWVRLGACTNAKPKWS